MTSSKVHSQKDIIVSPLLLTAQGAEKISNIIQLTESTVNKIAAGEVIERPASVVKELVENAIDAGSTQIDIEIEKAGLKMIKITDNGIGIIAEDVKIAFEKHTTSKIRDLKDLDTLGTLGFRGEALPSIAAVSRTEVITKARAGSESAPAIPSGTKLVLEAGKIRDARETGCPEGTIIKIKDLFFNVPARKKYLKSERTESAHITDWVMRFALAYPGIRFRLFKDGVEIINTPATGELLDTIAAIFGNSFARELIPINCSGDTFELNGFLGKPLLNRRDNSYQFIYVNGRYVSSKLIGRALSEAYHTLLMKHRYPTAVLNFKINPSKMDVNIHPTKLTIHFMEEKALYPSLVSAVKEVLDGVELIPEMEIGSVGLKTEGAALQTQAIIQPFPSTNASDEQSASGLTDPPQSQLDAGPEQSSQAAHSALTPPDSSTVNEQGTQQGSVHINQNINRFDQTALNISLPEDLKTGIVHKPGIDQFKKSVIIDTHLKGSQTYIPLCQLHDSYILVQNAEGLLIIDQHALHERIMYEKLKDQFESSPVLTQELIMPVSLEFNTRDFQVLMSYNEILKTLGFDLEAFGKNTVRIRSVPTVLGRLEDRNILNDLMDNLLALGRINKEDLQREKVIQIMACKAAVKAGQKLTESEIVEMLKTLPELTSPYTCAHGRPTILSMPLRELEKQFKRT